MQIRYRSYDCVSPTVAQEFDRCVTEYEYSQVTKSLKVKKDKKDLQAIIQSSADCALNKILSKYGFVNGALPSQMPIELSAPNKPIYGEDVRAEDKNAAFEQFQKRVSTVKKIIKENKNNEKKIEQKSKQSTVSQDGEKSASQEPCEGA